MKTLIGTVAALAIVGFSASIALANPAMLPKHEGYPSKGTSPVTGQSLANDTGQGSLGGSKALMQSVDKTDNHVQQKLTHHENARLKEGGAAGRLPTVTGPQIKIEPPVSSATKADASKGVK